MIKSVFSGLMRFLLKLCLFGVLGTALLFAVYFFNLDMKLIVNVIAPFHEKYHDKKEHDQYV